jgi:hypothetical protein
MRDALDMEDRVEILERVEAGVIAKRPLGLQFTNVDISFEHDLSVGRNLQVAGLAFDHLDRLAA